MLRTITIAAALAATVTATAQAEGPKAWSGLYIGAHGGAVWGSSTGTLGYDDAAFPGVTAADIFADTKREFDFKGWSGGGNIGWNWQSGPMVFGIEADMSAVHNTETKFSATTADTFTTWNMESRLYSLGTLRGRLGVSLHDNFMVYGTAGGAWGLVETSNKVTCVGCPTDPWAEGTERKSHLGFAAGGGAEWLLHPNVSLRVEYLYVNLGSVKHTFVGTALSGLPADETSPGSGVYHYKSDSFDHDLTFQTVRGGINIKF